MRAPTRVLTREMIQDVRLHCDDVAFPPHKTLPAVDCEAWRTMTIEHTVGGKFGVNREPLLALLLRYEMDWKSGTLVDANGLFLDTALPWIRDAGADGVALCWSDFREMHSFTIEDAGIALAMLHRAFPRGEGQWLAAVNGSWIAYSTVREEHAVLRLFAQPTSAHLA